MAAARGREAEAARVRRRRREKRRGRSEGEERGTRELERNEIRIRERFKRVRERTDLLNRPLSCCVICGVCMYIYVYVVLLEHSLKQARLAVLNATCGHISAHILILLHLPVSLSLPHPPICPLSDTNYQLPRPWWFRDECVARLLYRPKVRNESLT